MPFELKPSRPGDFAAELNIFLDDGYLRIHNVSVHGTAIE
jgi:hypothetical protein